MSEAIASVTLSIRCFALVVGAALVGCTGGPGSGPQCPSGQAQDPDGICRPVCETNANCGNCEVCLDTLCHETSCECTTDAECDDSDPCTGVETCPNGVCQAGLPHECTASGDPCFLNTCVVVATNPACELQPTGAAGCVECTTGTQCDDSDACTDDTCDAAGQCQNDFNTAPCDDGFACTNNDTCASGTCIGTTVDTACDDTNACTDDTCDPSDGGANAAGCIYANNTGGCDDGVGCTDTDVCSSGVCGGTPNDANCDDSIGCTTDTCDAALDCQHATVDTACDDSVVCTVDTCSATLDCQNTPNDGLCDDGAACTVDSCHQTNDCQFVTNDGNCDDAEVCTTDICDPASGSADADGCVFPNNTDACTDGNSCTTNQCGSGTCQLTGTLANYASCDDADSGTTPDICLGGVCAGGARSIFNHGEDCAAWTADDVEYDSRNGSFYALVNVAWPVVSGCTGSAGRSMGAFPITASRSLDLVCPAVDGIGHQIDHGWVVGENTVTDTYRLGRLETNGSVTWTGLPIHTTLNGSYFSTPGWYNGPARAFHRIDSVSLGSTSSRTAYLFLAGRDGLDGGGNGVGAPTMRRCTLAGVCDLDIWDTLWNPEKTPLGLAVSTRRVAADTVYNGLIIPTLHAGDTNVRMYTDDGGGAMALDYTVTGGVVYRGAVRRTASEIFLYGSRLDRCTVSNAGAWTCTDISISLGLNDRNFYDAAVINNDLVFVATQTCSGICAGNPNELVVLPSGATATASGDWTTVTINGLANRFCAGPPCPASYQVKAVDGSASGITMVGEADQLNGRVVVWTFIP